MATPSATLPQTIHYVLLFHPWRGCTHICLNALFGFWCLTYKIHYHKAKSPISACLRGIWFGFMRKEMVGIIPPYLS